VRVRTLARPEDWHRTQSRKTSRARNGSGRATTVDGADVITVLPSQILAQETSVEGPWAHNLSNDLLLW